MLAAAPNKLQYGFTNWISNYFPVNNALFSHNITLVMSIGHIMEMAFFFLNRNLHFTCIFGRYRHNVEKLLQNKKSLGITGCKAASII